MAIENVGPGGVGNNYGVRETVARERYELDKEYIEEYTDVEGAVVTGKSDPVTGGVGISAAGADVGISQSVEFFGVRESNSADLNSQRLQDALDSAPETCRYVLTIPPGKSYDFAGALLRKRLITLDVQGLLTGGTLSIGALPIDATAADIVAAGSELPAAMELDAVVRGNFAATPGSSSAAIALAYARGVDLVGLKVAGHANMVYAIGSASNGFSQAVARIKILNCDAFHTETPIKIVKGAGNATMHHADWQIIGGRHTDTILASDTAYTQRNIDADGIDGLMISGVYCFLSANTKSLPTKAQNIRVVRGTNILITGNQLFEAGEESILFDRVSGSVVAGNVIAFPGQRVVSSAIWFTGGDNVGNIYVKSSVGNNTIEGPSGHGIRIDEGCDYVSVAPNSMAALGSSSRFYGIGSPLGASAMDVSRADTLKSTCIARQASSAATIRREVEITATGDNQAIEIGDARVIYLRSASQLNIATFMRYGSMPTDPEDSITVIGITNASKLYYGAAAGRIALRDGVHINVSSGDTITLKPGTDPVTGVTRWYPCEEYRIGRTRTVTTTGSSVSVDIEDARTVLISPASALSVSSWTRNAKAMHTLSDQNDSFMIHATNGNTTLIHGASTMALSGGSNVTMSTGNRIKFEVRNGVVQEVWRNF